MALWTPAQLTANLGVWNDASKFTTTQTLTTWQNDGSLGNVACTGSVDISAYLLNSKPVVRFSTSQTYLISNAVLSYSAYTMFAVSRQTGGVDQRMFQSTVNNQLYGYWNHRKRSHFVDSNPGGYPGLTNALSSDTNWDFFATSRISNGPYAFIWNGSLAYSDSTSTANFMGGLAINTGAFPSEFSACEVAEILVYSVVLSDENIQIIEGYLAHKWGLVANLPAAHPYKNAAPVVAGVNGSVTIVDGPDALVATASIGVTATAAITDAADALVFTTSIGVTATAAITDAADALVFTTSVSVTAMATITDAADALVFTTSVGAGVNGSVTIVDGPDALVATASANVTATTTIIDLFDGLQFTASVGTGPATGIYLGQVVCYEINLIAYQTTVKVY